MDAIERLSLEAAQADTMLACEHRHRYEFASRLIAGRRVLDLCCGSGYGTRILAATAASVHGVDRDEPTIELARRELAEQATNVSFQACEALAFLVERGLREFDAVVCFEGLEHLAELEQVLGHLRRHAERGGIVIASLPNDKLSDIHNEFHVTQFGYDEALASFQGFPELILLPQFLAEGSLIAADAADEVEVELALGERLEPEYANHFIFTAGLPAQEVQAAHHGRAQLNTAPVFNRWSEDLKRGAAALRRENARLGRSRLGKADSAAATALARLQREQAQADELRRRLHEAEARVRALELADRTTDGDRDGEEDRAGTPPEAPDGAGRSRAEVLPAQPLPIPEGEDPNSWEWRRRRASEVLIPWIEQTRPLEGLTVLEYGCGNGAVSAAFAARCGRLIGYDIDAASVAEGRRELSGRGIANAQLEHRPLEEILGAVRAHRGQVDVFLLYAVLEHLTVQERLDVLALSRETVRPDGIIVVCETPNRLTYLDHHTAQMPFFHLLPDELSARLYRTSPRSELRAELDARAAEGEERLLEAIARWGRGVSFHEFEVAFGDVSQHVLASSYDPLLLGERPIHPEEVVLARYLDRVRPDLPPAFSRQWLDLILSPAALTRRARSIRPWTADTGASHGVGWTRWENLELRSPHSVLAVELPQPTTRLLVGAVAANADPLTLHVRPEGGERISASTEVAPPYTAYTAFHFSPPAQRLWIRASHACHLVLVGHES